MFYVAAALGGVSLVLAELATRGESPPRRRRRPHTALAVATLSSRQRDGCWAS